MTIAKITEAAGVAVGSFYLFYDSKESFAIYQKRETFFEKSLQENVDLIFDTIYRYMKEE